MIRYLQKLAKFATLTLATLAVFVLAAAAQTSASPRVERLGKKLMCICGCNQVLIECNHVNCSYSHAMLKEVRDRVARGESDQLILQDFVQEYGPAVLAAPPARGFDLWAWVMPIVAPLVGIALVWFVVVRWRKKMALAGAPKVSPELLARARRELEKSAGE